MQTPALTTPLLIYGPKHELLWTNPDMLNYAEFSSEPDEDGEISPYATTPVHRVWLNDKNNEQALCVIVHSPALEHYWEGAFKDLTDENVDDWKLENDPDKANAMVQTLLFELEALFLEDVWVVGGKQFCFTTIGKKIGRLFKRTRNVRFSPDCALYRDGDEYGYDT